MEGDPISELRKVEHLVYVTLKYTRTVDIIRSALVRMLSTLNLQIQETLEDFQADGKLDEVPNVPLLRCKKLEEMYPKDELIKDLLDFYHKVKKILAADYRKKEEYRKNVALVTRDEEINIHFLEDATQKIKKYIKHLRELE